MTAESDYKKQRAATIAADAAHTATMTALARRAGMSLDRLRRLDVHKKAAVIAKFRDK